MNTETINPKHEEIKKQLRSQVIPIINYRGVLLEGLIGGFKVLSTKVTTLEEVDEVIDRSTGGIQESLKQKLL